MSSDLCGNRWISVSGEETDTIATVPYSHVPCLIHMYRALITCTVSYSHVPCLIYVYRALFMCTVSYSHVPCLIYVYCAHIYPHPNMYMEDNLMYADAEIQRQGQ